MTIRIGAMWLAREEESSKLISLISPKRKFLNGQIMKIALAPAVKRREKPNR